MKSILLQVDDSIYDQVLSFLSLLPLSKPLSQTIIEERGEKLQI